MLTVLCSHLESNLIFHLGDRARNRERVFGSKCLGEVILGRYVLGEMGIRSGYNPVPVEPACVDLSTGTGLYPVLRSIFISLLRSK